MNIGIDITPLQTGHSMRGIGVYTRNLLDSLQKYGKQHSYIPFTRHQKMPNGLSLVHYPYFDPYFLTLPIYKNVPTVVTVHDLIPLVFPDKFPSGLRGYMKWQIQKFSLRRTSRIITDSKSSKNDLEKIVGIKKECIDVVYLAPSDKYLKMKPTKNTSIRNKYALPELFFVYVGDVNWNKNVSAMIKAFATTIQARPTKKTSLVLVGDAFMHEDIPETKAILTLIRALHIEPYVQRLGYVPDEELASVYGLALGLIQPSLYEGFGLPILEAFACGCPVVSSNSSSLCEISGPAIQFDPENKESIVKALSFLVDLPSQKRLGLVKEGDAWVKQFTWQRVARETIAVYEKVIGTH